jgi:hypothetical protein
MQYTLGQEGSGELSSVLQDTCTLWVVAAVANAATF